MTAFIVIFIVALFVVAGFLYATRRHAAQLRSLEDFRARWNKVDVEAFANLIDPAEEDFLRSRLPARDFRRLQRQRLRVARDYLGRVGHNAQLMVQAGQIVLQHNSGPEAEATRAHIRDAMRLRTLVFQAQVSLTLQLAIPGYHAHLDQVLRVYNDTTHSFDNALDPSVAVSM